MQPTDQVAAPAIAEETRKKTLSELVYELTHIERSLDEEGFDPAALVGDIKEDLASKVDALDRVMDEYASYALRTRERARRLQKRAQSAENRVLSLKTYIWATMKREGFERLNGHARYVEVRNLAPLVITTRPPTAMDFLALGPELVKVTPEAYDWKIPEVARRLKEPNSKLEFAVLEPHDHIVFEDRDSPAVGQKKGKKK